MKYLLTILLIFIVTVVLKKTGILHSLVWWDPWYYLLLPVGLLKITIILSNHLTNGPPQVESVHGR
jgi:hypothetical protein